MKFGGAGGIRTPDLLDAIEARSQLRHGPTEGLQFTTLAIIPNFAFITITHYSTAGQVLGI